MKVLERLAITNDGMFLINENGSLGEERGFYLVEEGDKQCVVLAEDKAGAISQAQCKHSWFTAPKATRVPFMLRGFSARVWDTNNIELNDKHTAKIDRESSGEIVVKVGCQKFSASKVKELYDKIQAFERAD